MVRSIVYIGVGYTFGKTVNADPLVLTHYQIVREIIKMNVLVVNYRNEFSYRSLSHFVIIGIQRAINARKNTISPS